MKSGLAWRFRMGVEECTYNCSSLARKLDATHAGAALPRHAAGTAGAARRLCWTGAPTLSLFRRLSNPTTRHLGTAKPDCASLTA